VNKLIYRQLIDLFEMLMFELIVLFLLYTLSPFFPFVNLIKV